MHRSTAWTVAVVTQAQWVAARRRCQPGPVPQSPPLPTVSACATPRQPRPRHRDHTPLPRPSATAGFPGTRRAAGSAVPACRQTLLHQGVPEAAGPHLSLIAQHRLGGGCRRQRVAAAHGPAARLAGGPGGRWVEEVQEGGAGAAGGGHKIRGCQVEGGCSPQVSHRVLPDSRAAVTGIAWLACSTQPSRRINQAGRVAEQAIAERAPLSGCQETGAEQRDPGSRKAAAQGATKRGAGSLDDRPGAACHLGLQLARGPAAVAHADAQVCGREVSLVHKLLQGSRRVRKKRAQTGYRSEEEAGQEGHQPAAAVGSANKGLRGGETTIRCGVPVVLDLEPGGPSQQGNTNKGKASALTL